MLISKLSIQYLNEVLVVRIKNSIKNISSGLLGQMILLITNFITRTVFIRTLGSTYLGVSGLFGNILSLLSLAELGIGQAIMFSLYKPISENNDKKISALMRIYKIFYRFVFIFVLVVGFSLTPFLRYIISDFEEIPNISIIYLMYVFSSASSYLFAYKNTLITATQKNYIINRASYVFSFLMMLVQVIELYLFKNYIFYLAVQICITIIQNLYTAHKATLLFPILKNKKVEKLECSEKNDLFKNVKSLMIYKIGSLALNSTDNILISMFVGITKVGLYSNYTLICNSVTAFLSTIFGNITASIGNLNAVETNEKKFEMFNIINLTTFWLYSVCSICIFCVANPFINAWIGSEYLLSYHELFIIVFNVYIGGMLFAPFNYRQTMGLFVYGKMRPIISALINIVASVILGKYFGLVGILWGTVIARVTTNVWFDPYIVFKIGLKMSPFYYFKDYIIKLILVFTVGMLTFGITSILPNFGFVSVMFKAIVSFLLVNISFLLIYGKSKEFNYLKGVAKSFLIRR